MAAQLVQCATTSGFTGRTVTLNSDTEASPSGDGMWSVSEEASRTQWLLDLPSSITVLIRGLHSPCGCSGPHGAWLWNHWSPTPTQAELETWVPMSVM